MFREETYIKDNEEGFIKETETKNYQTSTP